MSDAIDICLSSLSNSLEAMELISHNIANANVAGYKRSQPLMHSNTGNFEAHLSLENPSFNASVAPQITQKIDFTQGSLSVTENPLHVGIEGNVLFVVEGPGGPAYSRLGEFQIDKQGRLMLGGQFPVLGQAGEIVLNTQSPKITPTGEIFDQDEYVDSFRLAVIEDASQLEKMGAALYQSDTPLKEQVDQVFNLRQGYVESSNLVQADEVISMMKINRQVEMTQRILRGYDEMVGEAISTIAEF